MTDEELNALEDEVRQRHAGDPLAGPVLELIENRRAQFLPDQNPVAWALGGLRRALEEAPEATVAVGAFVTALVCPRHEKLCERIIVAALDAAAKRKKAEDEAERLELDRR